MENNLVVRLSKSGQSLFKQTTYRFILDGEFVGEINYDNLRIDSKISPGKHLLEIGESEYYIKQELFFTPEQRQTITIYPSLSHRFFRGFLIGLSITTIFFQYLILEKISIPLMFISIIPILTMWNRKSESFSTILSKDK